MAPEYPINTLAEMAAIPEEAMSRFLAELPDILAEMRRLNALMDTLEVIAGARPEYAGMSWCDDALDEFRPTFSVGDQEVGSFAIKRRR